MIYHPVVYHRDFNNDFLPPPPEDAETPWSKYQSVCLAALPLLSLYRPYRTPLSIGMSALRGGVHSYQMIQHFRQGRIAEGSFHALHTSLATASVALFFFNPTFGFLCSSVSDFIINTRACIEHFKAGRLKEAFEALAFMLLDLFFIVSLCYGMIEIVVIVMLLQLVIGLYLAAQHLRKGNLFEALCHTLMLGLRIPPATAQMQLLQWKYTQFPSLKGTLRQAENGFVYLDIPNKYVYSLFSHFNEKGSSLPPYFGAGKAGAHISIILSDEMKAGGFKIEEIGKTFSFQISHVDSVKPQGWNALEKVWFVAITCPEMEAMRSHYGLPGRIGGHDFHLTFGVKYA